MEDSGVHRHTHTSIYLECPGGGTAARSLSFLPVSHHTEHTKVAPEKKHPQKRSPVEEQTPHDSSLSFTISAAASSVSFVVTGV